MKTYDWLRQIPSALLHKDSTPLVGYIPPFPWDEFSQSLAQLFQIKDLNVKAIDALRWRPQEEFLAGFGDKPTILQAAVVATGGSVCWVMAEQDVMSLMNLLLTKDSKPLAVVDPEFKQGFYHFLAIEVIHALSQINFDKALVLHLVANAELPKEDSLCLDVEINLGQVFPGRLVISPDLQKGLKERYAQRTIDSTLLRSLEIPLHLEIGRTTLPASMLPHLALGDFIMLDTCSVKADGTGSVVVTIKGNPLFRGIIEEGGIKLMDYSLYNEVDMNSNDETPQNLAEPAQPDSYPAGKALPEEEFSEGEFEEEFEDEEAGEFDDEVSQQEKWPPPPESREESKMTAEVEQKHPEESPVDATIHAEPVEEEGFSIGAVQMPVVVELARLQMTIQKLMELQPGNLLELNVRPENGVDLVVNGKRIAKGELLLIGDVLGVRVIDIG